MTEKSDSTSKDEPLKLKDLIDLLPSAPAFSASSVSSDDHYGVRLSYELLDHSLVELVRTIYSDLKRESERTNDIQIMWESEDLFSAFVKYAATLGVIKLKTDYYKSLARKTVKDTDDDQEDKVDEMALVMPVAAEVATLGLNILAKLPDFLSMMSTKHTITSHSYTPDQILFKNLLLSQFKQQNLVKILDATQPDLKVDYSTILDKSSPTGSALDELITAFSRSSLSESNNKEFEAELGIILKEISAIGFSNINYLEKIKMAVAADSVNLYFINAKIEKLTTSQDLAEERINRSESLVINANIIYSYTIRNEEGQLICSRIYSDRKSERIL